MRAAMIYGIKDVRIEEIPDPHAGPGEVVLKVEAATTCGTDVKTYMRGHATIKITQAKVFGHECSGTVVEVGQGVTKFKLGDRVATHNTAPDGTCYYCKQSQPSMCHDMTLLPGTFAQYVKIPARIVEINAFKMPDSLDFASASLMEPFSCAVYGIDEIGIHLGDTVVVNGAGPIGLMHVRLAALQGAQVICCDLSDDRLAVAKRLGAAETINPKKVDDQVKAVRALTPEERGVDVAIEAVGLPETWEKTILMARHGGKVLLFGGCKAGTTFTVSTELMHYGQLTLKGIFHTTPLHVQKAFDMLCRGVIDSKTFVTGKYPLDKVVQAIEDHAAQKGIKSLIDTWA
jgi:L-iditol 2-dehydrogenase